MREPQAHGAFSGNSIHMYREHHKASDKSRKQGGYSLFLLDRSVSVSVSGCVSPRRQVAAKRRETHVVVVKTIWQGNRNARAIDDGFENNFQATQPNQQIEWCNRA